MKKLIILTMCLCFSGCKMATSYESYKLVRKEVGDNVIVYSLPSNRGYRMFIVKNQDGQLFQYETDDTEPLNIISKEPLVEMK